MGNVISIKSGSGAPTSGQLLLRELGIDFSTSKLYIGGPNSSIIPLNTAAAVGAINKSGDEIAGAHFKYYNTGTTPLHGMFGWSPIEIREAGLVANSQFGDEYAPAIGLHWSGVCGGALALMADGKFYRVDAGGQKYKIYDEQDAIPVTGGGTGATTGLQALINIGAAAASHTHTTSDISSGTFSIARGGTNGATRQAASNNLVQIGSNLYNNTDDTVANWTSNGFGVAWYSSSLLLNQPSTYGFMLNIPVNNLAGAETHQLWMTQSGGDLSHRGGNGSGWATAWKKIFDSSMIVSIANGGTGATDAPTAIANLGYAANMVIYSATEPTVVPGKIWLKPVS